MNFRLKAICKPKADLKDLSLTQAIRRQVGRLSDVANRLARGGLRSLSRRVVTKLLNRPISPLKALGHALLQPFPKLSARLYHLVAAPHLVTTASTRTVSSPNPRRLTDPSLLVKSFYKTAFGRLADEEGLAQIVHRLQSGMDLEGLAESLVCSPEFQIRHGSNQMLDASYIAALYYDGLERRPDLEGLEFWLAEGNKEATKAKALAAIAGSDEALETLLPCTLDQRASYRRWVARNDTIGDIDRATIRDQIAGLPFRPLISVVMRIERMSEVVLRESLSSVSRQLYPYWELCISIDDVSEPLLDTIPSGCGGQQVRVTRTGDAEDEAVATNAALSLARGDFVAFLRAGDTLPEHALYEVAFELGVHRQADIVYTDGDQIDVAGQRSNPWFKPGWDPDLLLSQNYLNALVVYRRSLVEEVGLLRSGFEGAEFHDLALRATAAMTPDRIRHVPAILYHRREENQTTHSGDASSDLWAVAALRAVRDHLDCQGDAATLLKPVQQVPGAIRVVWPVPNPEPLVSVIIPTRDRADVLEQCVEGVLNRTDYRNLELLIVDNGSIEAATLALFGRLAQEESRVRILCRPGPFNYSALNNAAARESNGEVLLFLNNDIDVIESGWLRELVSHAIRPDVGAVGAKLLYPDEQVQHGGVVLGPKGAATHVHRFADRSDLGYFGQLALTRTTSAVTAACLAIRRSVFLEVGGFDEVHLKVNYNDIDLCLRLGDRGYRVVWTPFAELFHFESVSRGIDDTPAKQETFRRERQHLCNTWGSILKSADPFHNPNLLFGWDYLEVPSVPRRERPWRVVF